MYRLAHLAFRTVGFLDQLRKTYHRDHVKVARGLASCALPQSEANFEENVSREDGEGGLALGGGHNKLQGRGRYGQTKATWNGPLENVSMC